MTKCIDDAERILGRSLTTSEKTRVTSVVQSIVTKDMTQDGLDKALRKAVDANMDATMTEALTLKRNTYLNTQARDDLTKFIERYEGAPANAIEAFLLGKHGGQRGTRNNVASSMASLNDTWRDSLLVDIDRLGNGVRQQVISGDLDTGVRTALLRMSRGETLEGIKPMAAKVAKLVADHNERIRAEANAAGASIGKLDGYSTARSHDMFKIRRAGQEKWMATMKGDKGLDMERSFPGMNPAEIDVALQELYNRFSSGEHIKLDGDPTGGLVGGKNIGRSLSHKRSLHFKSPEGETAYGQEFGRGTLIEAIVRNTETMAQNVAIMRRLGPNAELNLTRVIAEQKLKLQKTDGEGLARFGTKSKWLMDVAWPTVNGAAQIPGNAMAAQAFSIARGLKSMASLGMSVISAISDVPIAASASRFQGRNMFSSIAEQMVGIFKGLNDIDTRQVLAEMGVGIDGFSTTFTNRLDPDGGVPGLMTKMQNQYYRWNLLTPWTDRQSATLALSTSAGLATHTGRALGDVGESWGRILHSYGIDDAKWEAIRHAKQADLKGRKLVTAEAMRDLDDSFIDAIVKAEGKQVTNRTRADARAALGDTVRTMFQDLVGGGVVKPGAKTRTTLLRGTRPGEVVGESLRSIAHFKMFPFGVLQGPVAREMYGYGTGPGARKNQLMGLANLIVTNTMFGYAALVLKDLAKWKDPRDITNPEQSYKILMAAMVQGGGMGIYGDFLFGDMKNRFGGGAVATLAGPLAGTAGDVVDLMQRFRDGDDTAAQATRMMINNLPGANMFYLKAGLDYAVFFRLQEAMNPGYLKRMEKRMKKDNDQTYMYSPSQAVR